MPEEPAAVEFLAKYFRALGDPTRLRILDCLGTDERTVGELVRLTDSPQPKISNHLACLRWCGFVTARRTHRTVHYRVADERVGELLRICRELLDQNADHVASCRTIDAPLRG
jgi:DNA-binding transcriptional ArsR family regulator